MTACPCGSGRELDSCCGPIVAGAAAPSAEALMRSRYTAFAQRNLDHIERTHAPEVRDVFNRAEAERIAADVEWLGLDVYGATENGDSGTVDFLVRFRRDGQDVQQYEQANFRREEGRWLYVDGKVSANHPPRKVTKIGRNDPCPCGSGKKHKKCCGA